MYVRLAHALPATVSATIPTSSPWMAPSAAHPAPTLFQWGRAIWLWGSICGVVFGLLTPFIGILYGMVVTSRIDPNQESAVALLGVLDTVFFSLIIAIATFLAGALSKRWVSGVIAGALLALMTTAVNFVTTVVFEGPMLSAKKLLHDVVQAIVGLPFTLVVGVIVGACFGALGGLVGRALARRS